MIVYISLFPLLSWIIEHKYGISNPVPGIIIIVSSIVSFRYLLFVLFQVNFQFWSAYFICLSMAILPPSGIKSLHRSRIWVSSTKQSSSIKTGGMNASQCTNWWRSWMLLMIVVSVSGNVPLLGKFLSQRETWFLYRSPSVDTKLAVLFSTNITVDWSGSAE